MLIYSNIQITDTNLLKKQRVEDEWGSDAFATTAPLFAQAPDNSIIKVGLSTSVYESIIYRGEKRSEADITFQNVEKMLRQCFGDVFTYTSSPPINKFPELVCTGIYATKDEFIRNAKYLKEKREKEIKYIVKAFMREQTLPDKKKYLEIIITIENRFNNLF